MMMPANYSAIAENEMTYVVGGGLLEWAGENLADPIKNTKMLTTNLINIIANGFVKDLIATTMTPVFSGTWKPGDGVNAWTAKYITGKDGWNIAWGVVGNLAAIYQLATVKTKTVTDSVLSV